MFSVWVYFAVYLWSEPFLIVITAILGFAEYFLWANLDRDICAKLVMAEASQVMFAKLEFWENSSGCNSCVSIHTAVRVMLERDSSENFASMQFSSYDHSKFSHFIFWANFVWLYNRLKGIVWLYLESFCPNLTRGRTVLLEITDERFPRHRI